MSVYIALVLTLAAALGACKQREAVTTDLANVCAADNEKKYISTTGFVTDRGSILCSNPDGGRMDCGIDIAAAANAQKVFTADIEEGSGANEIGKIEGSYKASDVKILDNASTPVKINDKVKFIGQMSITPDGSVCFMVVDKIEKQ